MSTFDGSVFEGIPNLNYSGTGHPLVEIEVITPGNNSAKFIISKMTLYVVAFSASKIWFQFWCEYDIKDFRLLVDFNGSYTTKPWKFVGPYCMIEAIDTLANPSLNESDMRPYVEACEVFYVHLSEAARLYAIESVICKTLTPPQAGEFDGRTYEDEESATLVDEKGGVIQATEDVYALVAGDGPVNFDLAVKTPDFIESLLKKFSNLSKVWYVFALSGRKLFEMAPGDVSRFHMRSVKSLRCTLGVLCNINLDKVLQEWKRKSATHEIITPEVYKEMEREVRQLQEQKKVLLPK